MVNQIRQVRLAFLAARRSNSAVICGDNDQDILVPWFGISESDLDRRLDICARNRCLFKVLARCEVAAREGSASSRLKYLSFKRGEQAVAGLFIEVRPQYQMNVNLLDLAVHGLVQPQLDIWKENFVALRESLAKVLATGEEAVQREIVGDPEGCNV
jgi:hypothetical protein